jgi:nucleotide-binding universal stress UspA family protein
MAFSVGRVRAVGVPRAGQKIDTPIVTAGAGAANPQAWCGLMPMIAGAPGATLGGNQPRGVPTMILICYDGSADAQSAIDCAARLMPRAEATLLTVWEPYLETIARSGAMGVGFGLGDSLDDGYAVDAASRETALAVASEGAARATSAGLVAHPRIASRLAGVASAILDVVVLGTRGRGGVRSYVLGNVSHEVTQHADRPVLVAPSAGLARQRRAWAWHVEDPAGVV